MRRSAGGKRFVTKFANAPGGAQFVERRRIYFAVEQREIAEWAGDWRARTGHPAAGQLDRRDSVARGEAHLHRELRRCFDMSLHGPGALAVLNPERVADTGLIEAAKQRQRRRRAKSAAIGRPEKPHRRS